jgi:hypothetical protein
MARTGNTGQYGSGLTDLILFRRRWWQHLLFWGAALVILLNIFSTSSTFQKIDLIYTLCFNIPLAAVVYLNLYVFIPRYLRRERYLLYALCFILLVGTGAVILYFLFDRWIDYILPGYYFISYYSIPHLMLYTGSFLLLTTLLKLSRSWFLLLRMERMTTRHQLQSLQSQINPHFLLNSLQTIYALSMEGSARTPGVILQLSDILKYTLYETGQSRVKLEKEIRMIGDYVEVYRYRVDPGRAVINFRVEGDPAEKLIAPMLFIPFIENSFKHGLQGGQKRAWVDIGFRIEGDRLHFEIANNLGKTDPVRLENQGGIGIGNTRQRLELLYPGRHSISIRREEDSFRVSLELELDE